MNSENKDWGWMDLQDTRDWNEFWMSKGSITAEQLYQHFAERFLRERHIEAKINKGVQEVFTELNRLVDEHEK